MYQIAFNQLSGRDNMSFSDELRLILERFWHVLIVSCAISQCHLIIFVTQSFETIPLGIQTPVT